jgi:predicted RNase H-like HicB family nuclease
MSAPRREMPISGGTLAVPMAVGDEHLTIHIEDAGDGWFVARIVEEPAAISQGRTPEEARANVIAALHDLTNPTARPSEPLDRLRIRVDGVGRRLRALIAR